MVSLSALLTVSFLISPLSKPVCDAPTWVIGLNPTQPFPKQFLSQSVKKHEYLNMESVTDMGLPPRVRIWLPSSRIDKQIISHDDDKDKKHMRYKQWNTWQEKVTGHTVSYPRFQDLEQQLKHHIVDGYSGRPRHVYLAFFWLLLESVQRHNPHDYCTVSPLIHSQVIVGSDYVYFDEQTDSI
jgi:hypothetical protein